LRLLVRDTVDRDQRAIDDRVRQPSCPTSGLRQVLRVGCEQVDRFAQVPPHGTD
jgi:hypothetical protein